MKLFIENGFEIKFQAIQQLLYSKAIINFLK